MSITSFQALYAYMINLTCTAAPRSSACTKKTSSILCAIVRCSQYAHTHTQHLGVERNLRDVVVVTVGDVADAVVLRVDRVAAALDEARRREAVLDERLVVYEQQDADTGGLRATRCSYRWSTNNNMHLLVVYEQ